MMQRINRGKAEAVFHTGFTGGLRSHHGAPADPNRKVTIKPFEEQGVSHYCAEDWHVILLGLSIGEGTVGLTVTSVGEAKKLFAPTVMTFVLDGQPFETTRLPVKPLLNDDPGKWFGLVQGRVVGPDELAAGSHTLSVTVENDPDPEFAETYTMTRQFFIDAAGTGVCT
jgi:hypothetical protein